LGPLTTKDLELEGGRQPPHDETPPHDEGFGGGREGGGSKFFFRPFFCILIFLLFNVLKFVCEAAEPVSILLKSFVCAAAKHVLSRHKTLV
jgi:hypothetical protein